MDIGDLERKLGIDGLSADEQMALLDALQKSAQTRLEIANQESIGKSTEVVIQGLKKIKSDLETRFTQLNATIESKASSLRDGKDGKDGKNGKDGLDGKQGLQGSNGQNGRDGRDGLDGTDGISVTSARIDFDGSLVIGLSSGAELNVGEVVAPDLAESIKVITNGGGTSQSVLDSIASLQSQITAMAGFVNYEGTWNASTNTPTLASSVGTKGDYYVVSVTGTTNLNGVTAWTQGDWAIFNGSAWEKVDNTDLVTSVAGRTGAITLTTADVSGLGTISTQASSNVSITGGSITGITDLAVADGGTGASDASGARTNLGLVIGTDVLAPNGSAASLTSFPTFNQNTTGTASNVTGTVAVLNGGTGATTTSGARTNLGLVIGTDVLAPTGSAASLTSFPTFNQNTTGTAASTPKLLTTNFTIEESGGKLLFKYGATTIASMSSTGVITSATNIIANGTP
jgi:hypothetical protein